MGAPRSGIEHTRLQRLGNIAGAQRPRPCVDEHRGTPDGGVVGLPHIGTETPDEVQVGAGIFGGWVTGEIVGPFKGERGSEGW